MFENNKNIGGWQKRRDDDESERKVIKIRWGMEICNFKLTWEHGSRTE